MEAVLFPDAEAVAVAYLTAELDARDDNATVATFVPTDRATNPRFVKVSRTGGTRSNLVTDLAVITVEAWDVDTERASQLAGLCRALLGALVQQYVGTAWVRSTTELGGTAYFPDLDSGQHRYQLSVELNLRGEPL